MEQLTFSIKGKNYTTLPLKVGRILDMWKMRSLISMGTYGQIYRAGLDAADDALMIVDIEAFMSSFVPDFINDLKPGNIQEMGIKDFIELKDVYAKDIHPWLRKIEEMLKGEK